jgi:hypothetical protein
VNGKIMLFQQKLESSHGFYHWIPNPRFSGFRFAQQVLDNRNYKSLIQLYFKPTSELF